MRQPGSVRNSRWEGVVHRVQRKLSGNDCLLRRAGAHAKQETECSHIVAPHLKGVPAAAVDITPEPHCYQHGQTFKRLLRSAGASLDVKDVHIFI